MTVKAFLLILCDMFQVIKQGFIIRGTIWATDKNFHYDLICQLVFKLIDY